MKSASFAYARPATVEQVVSELARHDGLARVLAGGQSLVPMMHMRLVQPAILLDVNRIAGLDHIEVDGDVMRIGALTRYSTVEASALVAEHLPLLREVVRHIGDRQVRNRGTLGGSLAQADPVGEIPLACLVLDATVVTRSARATCRMPIREFVLGPYTTALEPDELIVEIEFPLTPTSFRFMELGRRHNDFAVIAVAVLGSATDGRWHDLRVAIAGGDDHPLLVEVGDAVLDQAGIERSVSMCLAAIDPLSDVRASAEYRTHLIGVHVRRLLEDMA